MTTREKRNDIVQDLELLEDVETTVDDEKIITTPMTTAKINKIMTTKVNYIFFLSLSLSLSVLSCALLFYL